MSKTAPGTRERAKGGLLFPQSRGRPARDIAVQITVVTLLTRRLPSDGPTTRALPASVATREADQRPPPATERISRAAAPVCARSARPRPNPPQGRAASGPPHP